MDLSDRRKLLSSFEEQFSGIPLVYFTSERKPPRLFSSQIALDVLPLFYKHIAKLKENKDKFDRICLFLCSNGGNLDAPWPIVSLLREYCKELYVIVPYKALSAATLIALGADKIVMTPLSQLSPVDPQGNFEKDGKKINIEVEDVLGFVDFAKDKIGLADQSSLTEVLKLISSEVHPTILGSVNRTYSLIRRLSENLLKTHMKNLNDEKRISQIVDNLTQKLFSHRHFINREEARNDVGFKDIVEYANDDQELIMNQMFDVYYNQLLEIENPFNPIKYLGKDNDLEQISVNRAIIETEKLTNIFKSELVIKRLKDAKQESIDVSIISSRWEIIS